MTAAVTTDEALRGRNSISSRAVRRVVSAVTAEALDVRPSDVSVDVEDFGSSLAVTARTALRIDPLGTASARPAESLLDRLSAAQSTIGQRVLQLTGSRIDRVDLRITRADLRTRKRVS